MEIWRQNEQDLGQAMDNAIQRVSKHIPNRLKGCFRDMVLKYKYIFRTRLGSDAPVDVLPMQVNFEGTECPVKVRPRTYSPEQLDFMKKKCDELLEVGYISLSK